MIFRGWPLLVLGTSLGCAASNASSPGAADADQRGVDGASDEASSENASGGAALSEGARCVEDARAAVDSKPGMPLKIEVSHILVRHRELDDPRGATRTAEQACLRALEALHALQGGAEWADTVKRFSDSPNADLGRVAPEDLAPGFSEAAFTLDINQLSYVVESPRGYHVILRTH